MNDNRVQGRTYSGPLTVGQLVEMLRGMPQDAPVYLAEQDWPVLGEAVRVEGDVVVIDATVEAYSAYSGE